MSDLTGVLLMAYGSPDKIEDVEAYYTHIRRGRKPSAEQLADLVDRYRQIGGSQLNAITFAVASAVERALNEAGEGGNSGHDAYRVYVGMKHWHPYIADTVDKMAADGVKRAVAVVLTPQYSRMSVGEYLRAARERAEERGIELIEVNQWWDAPGYVEFMAERVRAALERFDAAERADVHAVFTAHSLPERILQWDDPYPKQLLATSEAISEAVGVKAWHFAYQSASHTGEPWLGPDVLEKLEELKDAGARSVIVCPVGFVSDHLEVRYDIDVEAADKAKELGIHLERSESPNANPKFVDMLARLTRGYAERVVERKR